MFTDTAEESLSCMMKAYPLPIWLSKVSINSFLHYFTLVLSTFLLYWCSFFSDRAITVLIMVFCNIFALSISAFSVSLGINKVLSSSGNSGSFSLS